MGATVRGLISGIDVDYFIDSMVDLEYNRVRIVESQKSAYQLKINAYSQLQSLVSDLGSKASGLQDKEDFNIFSTSSSNEDIVTFEAGVGSVEGRYDLRVFQLAQAEKMVSANGLITSQSEALSTFGITPGDISINGVVISIDADDTIQDLRMKINNATDEEGKSIGVTASVIKAADDNFRIVLSAEKTGSEGVEYKDVTGSTLQDLGIILDADGTKGNYSQILQSANDISTAFAGLAIGGMIEYEGTDRNGNAVKNIFIKGATSTIEDFLRQVGNTFNGMAEVTVDVDGKLNISDNIQGFSQLNMTSFSINGMAEDINIVQAGENGDGVLSVGNDAFFSIDGLLMQASSNSVDGVINGVNFDFHKADANETVHIEMVRDFNAITDKVEEMIEAFNAIIRFSRENTSWGDPEDEDSEKGTLAGDMTVRTIVSRIKNIFSSKLDLLGGKYTTLSQLGLKTTTSNGELELDKSVFKNALEENFGDVVDLFISKGFSDNGSISMGRYTEDTTSGQYTLEEVDADHLRIQLAGDSVWYTSNARNGDVITFEDGPAKGLSITVPPGSISGTASFTFSRGLAELLNDATDKLTDVEDGLISIRKTGFENSIKRSDARIERLERSIEAYRLRLVSQFSTLEQTMSQLQAQGENMLSALGYNSGG